MGTPCIHQRYVIKSTFLLLINIIILCVCVCVCVFFVFFLESDFSVAGGREVLFRDNF